MAFEINLLTKKEGIPESVLKISRFVKYISLFLLLLFIISSIVVIGIRIFMAIEGNNRAVKVKTLKEQIENSKTTESTYTAFLQKISTLDTLISDRFFPEQIIKKMNEIIPADAKINTVKITADLQDIDFSVESDSAQIVDEVSANLANENNPPLASILMQSFIHDITTNTYTADFKISFNYQSATLSAAIK